MSTKIFRNVIRLMVVFLLILVISGGGYSWWNSANPDKTCASCHEISPSHQTWASSAHRDISCFKCHGTALGNGWHSLTEKVNMVFTHSKSAPHHDEIRMTEDQVLE
ncbi:MAG TPA: NapC/NirT family cytochrome c, partial [Draconibacterium sp.]|nr:NapC/NirT family cytochrome c [Draconibacterium sp.]